MAFEFTDSNFQNEVLDNNQVTLIDLWAEWCGPCRMMAPAVDALAEKYAGQAVVGKLNVDENSEVPTKYNVRGIPTFLIFKGGQLQEKLVGAMNPQALEAALVKHL